MAFKIALKGTEGLVEWEHVVTLFLRATLGEIVLRVWPEFVVLHNNGHPTKFRIPVSLGPLFARQVGEKRDAVTGLLTKWNQRSFHATSGVASSYRKELPKFTIADNGWTLPTLKSSNRMTTVIGRDEISQ